MGFLSPQTYLKACVASARWSKFNGLPKIYVSRESLHEQVLPLDKTKAKAVQQRVVGTLLIAICKKMTGLQRLTAPRLQATPPR